MLFNCNTYLSEMWLDPSGCRPVTGERIYAVQRLSGPLLTDAVANETIYRGERITGKGCYLQ